MRRAFCACLSGNVPGAKANRPVWKSIPSQTPKTKRPPALYRQRQGPLFAGVGAEKALPGQRARLCRALVELAPDCAPQREWDDAVAYLTGGPPAPGPEAAKAALLDWLAQP